MRVPSRSRMIWEILSFCGGGRGEEGTAVVTAWASSLDSIIMVATASKLRCSLLLLLCRCGLAVAPSPWRICPTNAPWIKRYKKKPPAGDTCSSGPTECQFLLLLPVWAFALLSFRTHFFLVFLLLLLSQNFEIPCHFLAVGPWCALTKPWSIKANIVLPFHALNLCKDWWILMKI